MLFYYINTELIQLHLMTVLFSSDLSGVASSP